MERTSKQSVSVRSAAMSGKEKYRVPSMKEIFELPWNGFNVVSTFSGGGGSCLGYEMAGYHVVWANEFIPEAQNTYRLNHKLTHLNTKDIRQVTAEDIYRETGLKKGEIDLFDGSPPCCAFSTAGSRENGWGKVREYSDSKQRVDDLFFEYTRLIKELQPKVFVAENVSGLVKGTAKGYFKLILAEMKACGYEVSARLLNAKYLGVPQARERLIFVGVRNDLVEKYNVHPCHPKPKNYIYTIADAFEDLKDDPKEVKELTEVIKKYKVYQVMKKLPKNPPRPVKGSKVMNGSYFNLSRESMYQPCSTICQMNGQAGAAGNIHPLYDRKFTIAELKRITSIPDDFILTGDFAQKWERLGRMVPPIMMREISANIAKEILCKIK